MGAAYTRRQRWSGGEGVAPEVNVARADNAVRTLPLRRHARRESFSAPGRRVGRPFTSTPDALPPGVLPEASRATLESNQRPSPRTGDVPSSACENRSVPPSANPFVCKRFAERPSGALSPTSRIHKTPAHKRKSAGGPRRIRTADLRRAKALATLPTGVRQCHWALS